MLIKSIYRLWIMGIIFLMPIIASAQVADSSIVPTTNRLDTMLLDSLQLPPFATDYQWLNYRGKADITDTGGTRTCNFYYVNRKDSIIYINLHSSGIEIVRLVLTPDSMTYVNKLTYQFYKGTYAPFKQLLRMPIDFYAIQSIFNGQTESIEQMLRNKRYVVNYDRFVEVDSTRSFFTELNFKDLNHLFEIRAVSKVVRFDVPGPTAIRIPEKFQEIKF